MNTIPEPLIPQRADPHVSFYDGWYYFTASVPEYDRIELRRAKTVAGLAEASAVIVWRKHKRGPQSVHVWAPELHRINGAWYLYYAAGDVDAIWEIRPYVLECRAADPCTGPWVEKGPLQPASDDPFAFRDFSLDATTFEHRGVRYLVWAQKVGGEKGTSNLYIARLETPWKLATVLVQLTMPDYDWERIGFWVNEGPAVLIKNGRVWMTFSASATGACYCMGLLSAPEDADLLDPGVWTKSRQPVFATDPEVFRFGPGHNSFTVAEDGVTDLMVYHARTYAEIQGDPLYDPNRHTWVKPLKWNARGCPEF